MDKKRNRSVNWDEEEKQLFRCVLKDYAQIIEDKTLTTNTNKIKTKAWEEVHKKFNGLNSRQRDLNQLKIQWKAMKVNARKTYGTYQKESKKTGGGARPATPDDTVIQIKDLLNPAELLRDHNKYDSDGIVFNPSESLKQEEAVLAGSDTNETCALPALQDVNMFTIEEVDTQIEMDTQEEMDTQIHILEFSPLSKLKDTSMTTTPLNMGNITSRKKPTRKLKLHNTTALKSRKDHHDDYINKITTHSYELKEKEYARRMEMADEEHKIKIKILELNLKQAELEHQISEKKLQRLD